MRYVLGPYTGTNMYAAAIESYLRANGVHSAEEVVELRYRAGEWPGHLLIRTRDGRELRAEKFYYNYLIPFYITQSTLYSVDFTNELTDISVGDAWHPRYEAQGGGFSVVVARSAAGQELIGEMQEAGALHLEDADCLGARHARAHARFQEARSFIRMAWRGAAARAGLRLPPATIPLSRIVEVVIASLFALCGTRPAPAGGVDPDPGARPGLQHAAQGVKALQARQAQRTAQRSSSPPPKAANPCPTILTSPHSTRR